MMNNETKFEYQEYFIMHNNSIIKFTICKTNEEIIIKSNNYEAKLNHQSIENLINMKFDSIEKEYNYLLNLFQQNSIMIKDMIINKSLILSFIQNGKMKDILLSYNNESKSIIHYELNSELKNLMSDIAQIKKDVHDIHNAIQNNNSDNKNNIFESGTKEADLYNNFVIENTLNVLDKQIKNQENYLNELEKQSNDYKETAKQLLKEGEKNKDQAKNLLRKKKRCVEKATNIKGLLALFEEQKLILEKTRQMQDFTKEIQCSQKAIIEATRGLTPEELKAIQDEIEELKKGQEDLNQFFDEYGEKEDDEIENNEEKKEVKKEEKKEEKKDEKKEEKEKKEVEDDKKFEKFKEEGINAMKDSILAIIFANEGISLEGLKRIQDQLDNIKKKQEEFDEFFK